MTEHNNNPLANFMALAEEQETIPGIKAPLKSTALIQEAVVPHFKNLREFDAWMKEDAHNRANKLSEAQAELANNRGNMGQSAEKDDANTLAASDTLAVDNVR